MSQAETLLGLTVREAVLLTWDVYLVERPRVRREYFEEEEVRMQFLPLLFETARCLLEHMGVCKISRCGRCFQNIENVADILMGTSNGEQLNQRLVESAREPIWNASLGEAVNGAVDHAFCFANWCPNSQLVEIAYGKQCMKEKISDLLWAFCRTADEGPRNALLAVSNILNSGLDSVNSNEQFHLDLLFHRTTGELPPWTPFQDPMVNLRIAELDLSPIQESETSEPSCVDLSKKENSDIPSPFFVVPNNSE